MNKNIIIIDSYSLLYKAFYGVRPMHASDGTPTNAIYGFMNMIIKLISDRKPDYIYAAFDAGKLTFRHEFFSEYKAGREKMPEELRTQIPIVTELLKKSHIAFLSCESYEADDIIGYVGRLAEKNNDILTIVTGDRDSFQLVSDNVSILYAKRGVSDTVYVNKEYIADNYGLTPEQLIDLKALMGDKSDNIPGIPGVGEKTALDLMHKYLSLDGIYENIEDMRGKLKEKLIDGKESAYLSQKLGRIAREVPIDIKYDDADDYNLKATEVIDILKKYEMKNLIKSIGVEGEAQSKEEELEFIEQLPELKKFSGKKAAVYFSSDDVNAMSIGIACNKDYFALKNVGIGFLKQFCECKDFIKFTHNFKPVYKSLINNGIDPVNFDFDAFVAAYVIEPSDERYDLSFLAKKYLDISLMQKEEAKQQTLFDTSDGYDPAHVALSAKCILQLYDKLYEILKTNCELKLYEDIEHKLLFVLGEMENIGFSVDVKMLQSIGDDFDERIDIIQSEILKLADKDASFNINSTKQLGVLLFDELGLPVIKKTKTGYSTDIEVLEKLRDAHPIIPMIIELRQLAKLNSTYVKGMVKLADSDGKIHSSFNQTITTTGRISSSAPNLQNIPVKTEEGRVIRKVFIPSRSDGLIVSADYSQIELRVLAHISGDENMIEAFKNNVDIHTKTASEVFGVPLDMVSKSQRSKAKAVNFGIVYGISDFGLGRNLHISRKEAGDYIETYLSKFPDVKRYMSDIVISAKEKGYVSTMFGRRRYIPDIFSANKNVREFGERTALNTPIQGTAADIIKIAMVNVSDAIKENRLSSKLILQVHDELIIDCVKEDLDIIVNILKEKMECAAQLKVPLIADVNYGVNWYEAK